MTEAEVVKSAVSALDKAAEKGAIHPRNAARRKSRLMKAANQSAKAPAAEAPVTKAKKK
jgi:small subunit ribosomal protein S20